MSKKKKEEESVEDPEPSKNQPNDPQSIYDSQTGKED